MSEYRWLTELSQLFLERDYLMDGQTVDERVNEICKNAELILKKENFAKRFKENVQKGWYSLSTPIWINFGNNRGLPISCVVGETWINTYNGGGKQAKDICVGDMVLTHRGRYKPVTNIMVNEDKSDIYKLKVNNINLHITGNHLVLTNLEWVRTDELDSNKHLIAVNKEIKTSEWIIEYASIQLIEKTTRKETVYDFTVEEDHSFSAAGVILHNCFGSLLEDSMESIASTWSEVCMMTKYGGGTSGYFGNLRHRGSKIKNNGESSGSVHFMQAFDSLINVVSQGKSRRGNFAAYLPISHPDIEEFLKIRTEGAPIQNLSFGITVEDQWMKEMISGDMKKRSVWAKVLEARNNLGFPYIMFTDNVNNNTVDCYKDKGMKITHSNLCSEIMLPDTSEESFVCDLSSMNLIHYDEWKDTDAVELLVYFLDAVMTEFINKASEIKFMEKTVNFARRHRALGVGYFGWHSLLQSKMIAFESMEAKLLNTKIAKNIKHAAYKASEKLAEEYGEPEVCKGYGRRNTTLLAVAPTKSSAFIIGQASESIEPHRTNYYIKDLQKGKFTIKNEFLVKVLQEKDMDTDDVWLDILKHGGSVQHLDFLSDHEKNVFKTFGEISQKEVLIQASQRQKYIDQGQSINLMIHPSIPIKDVNQLIIFAWENGIKSLYYQISVNAAQNFSRNILQCASCEG